MTKKYLFYVETYYIGCRVEEEIELEFDDDQTPEEIEEEVIEYFESWVWENIEAGYKEIKNNDPVQPIDKQN